MKKNAFWLLLGAILCTQSLYAADQDWPTQLKQRFQTYWQKQQPEKIYLHTDRSFYAPSDTVWFKAYLTDARNNELKTQPEIVYLNLVSVKNTSVISQKIKTVNGLAAGSIILPDSLKSGNYLLQAYTSWQRNLGPESFFRQPITINNALQIPPKTLPGSAQKVVQNLYFFPEGGKLLAEFENKIAFKAAAADGSAVAVEGGLLDESGKILTSFKSNQNGIGSFKFQPQVQKSYIVQVQSGSQKQLFPLTVAPEGYTLSVKNQADSVNIAVAATSNNLNKSLYFTLKSQGSLIVADSVQFDAKGICKRTFSSRNWPQGIIQVSLLNAEGKVESERSFFHENAKVANVKLETSRKAYSRREPVQLNLSIADANGNPFQAEFSIAVTNSNQPYSPSIKSNLLLTSEIAGAVNMPEYYLNNPEELDDLLLTQNLRNSSWATVLDRDSAEFKFKREAALPDQGHVLLSGLPVKKAIVYLLETPTGRTHLVTTDTSGFFILPDTDANKFFYQVWQNGLCLKEAKLHIQRSEPALPTEAWNTALFADSVATAKLMLQKHISRIYAADIKKIKGLSVNPDLWPPYTADKYYPLEDYNEFTNIEEIFKEIVPNVRIIRRNGEAQANIYNSDKRNFFPYQPLYIIDGQPTWNNDLFLRLDATQLKQVNVYYSAKNLEKFGFMGNQGVIAVYTKSGNYQSPELLTEHILTVPSRSVVYPFSSKPLPANIPDFRPTLYWNPKVQTNAEGKATINFQTSDEIGNLRVQVEGITKDGKLISGQLTIPVQPAE